MPSGFLTWSQTDANNASADSSIGWPEGMSPAAVNDSARSLMARAAGYRDDIAGVKPANSEMVTGGSANAQTLSTNMSINPAALTNGWMLTFRAGFTNTGPCTLSVDSTSAKPIQGIAATPLLGGEIVFDRFYTVHYHQPLDAWVLHNAGQVPTGIVATAADIRSNTAGKVLTTNALWGAGAVVALTDAASIAVDLATGWNFSLALLATGHTLTNPNNAKPGECGFIRITSVGGNYTLAKGSGWLSTTTFPITINNGALKYLFYSVYSSAPIVLITGILTDPG